MWSCRHWDEKILLKNTKKSVTALKQTWHLALEFYICSLGHCPQEHYHLYYYYFSRPQFPVKCLWCRLFWGAVLSLVIRVFFPSWCRKGRRRMYDLGKCMVCLLADSRTAESSSCVCFFYCFEAQNNLYGKMVYFWGGIFWSPTVSYYVKELF